MKYAFRDGTCWKVTDDPRDLSSAGDVVQIGKRLTKPDIDLLIAELEAENAQKEVDRAGDRLRSAQERLRIEKLKHTEEKRT